MKTRSSSRQESENAAPIGGLSATVLGSGTSVPNGRRAPPAFALRSRASSIVIDCGAGSTTALTRHGITLDLLDAVLLTHLHPDHTAELVPLLFALKNPRGPRRRAVLPIYGPRGLKAHIDALRSVYGPWIEPRLSAAAGSQDAPVAAVETHELDPYQLIIIGDLRVRPYPVDHGDAPAFAYRIETSAAGPAKTVCFSGDSGSCEALCEAAAQVDLFFCECGAASGERLRGHLDASEVADIVRRSGCRHVVLTHLYDHVEAENPAERVRAGVDATVSLAADDMHLTV